MATTAKRLSEIVKDDIISLRHGFDMVKGVVMANNGTHIVWFNYEHSEKYSKVFSYSELKKAEWTFIGRYKKGLFCKKIIYV